MLEAWKSECLYSFFLSFLFGCGGGEGIVEFITMNLILGGYIPWVYQNFIELLGWKLMLGKCLEALKQLSKLVLRWAIFPIWFCFLFLPFWIFVMIAQVTTYLFILPKDMWEKDLAMDSPIPCYLPSDKSHLPLSSFLLTAVGSFITRNMVRFFSF